MREEKIKVYLNSVSEDWIVDRLRKEWYQHNKEISTKFTSKSNIIWIISPWGWKKINLKHLKNKKVLCTIHHIDEDKFDEKAKLEFKNRDQFVDEYHVVSKTTYEQVQLLTKKNITYIPFWVNNEIWFHKENKEELRKKYGFNNKEFLIGSFQRDSEGHDLTLPKLSKGPDRFVEIVKEVSTNEENLRVILTGRRRNYIIHELEKNNINYSLFEMADFSTMNDLYNCLNLYIVTSRYEGGPQAILEAAVTKTPIISTKVGIAQEILSKASIFEMDNFKIAKPDTEFAYESVSKLNMTSIFKDFSKLLNRVLIN